MHDVSKIPYFSAVHPRFNAGEVSITQSVIEGGRTEHLRTCLGRHVRGDWGIVDADAARDNERGLRERQRIRSVYALDPTKPCTADNCLWLVTDLGPARTLFLLASEA